MHVLTTFFTIVQGNKTPLPPQESDDSCVTIKGYASEIITINQPINLKLYRRS